MLKPVLRVVDNLEVGTITGTVTRDLHDRGQCGPTPSGVYPATCTCSARSPTEPGTPDDTTDLGRPEGGDALTSAMVDPNTLQLHDRFRPAGDYRLAYTCDNDDPS